MSNGIWLLWIVLQRDRRVGGGVGGDREGDRDAVRTSAVEERGGEGGEEDDDEGKEAREDDDEDGREEGEAGGNTSPQGIAIEEDILRRRDRIVQWLSVHCIYCEVTGAPQSSSRH